MIKSVTAQQLRAMFGDGEELALLDAREEQAFGASHIFYASCMPPGRIELLAPHRLPRRGVRVVFCDAGEGEAERAAERLAGYGWSDVSLLAGGIGAWADAGFELFSAVNVPGLALEPGATRLLDEADDVWLQPREHGPDAEQEMRDYLAWEVDLVPQLFRDGTARFELPAR